MDAPCGGWMFVAKLDNGESFYSKLNGELAVEKDFTRLVDPTDAEAMEIFARFPSLDRRGADRSSR